MQCIKINVNCFRFVLIKIQMANFDDEILAGLEFIPTPNSPGTLIVTANAQSVYAANDAGNTILAACTYGKTLPNRNAPRLNSI